MTPLPPVVFVLGKGGVGRTTIAAALGAGFASRGERVIVAQWSVEDALSPWFGLPPTRFRAQQLLPNLATKNYSMDEAFEQYFVEHLHMRAFYRAVVSNRHVRRAMRAAPGLAELMFLGNAMAMTTIERTFDRVIVDAQAMGHGASLFAMPQATRTLGLGGLLAVELQRVTAMLQDPARSAAVVVATPEELAVEETLEFWPRIAHDLGRPPAAAVINLSTRVLGALPATPPAWYEALDVPAPFAALYAQLARRAAREAVLAARLDTPIAVDDALLVADAPTPRDVIALVTRALAPLWSAT